MTDYDVLAYPTTPHELLHPSHFFAVARLFGVAAPAVGSSRVLEVGCGEATHLVACASGMPDASFVGIDLSAEAVARGRQLVAAVGLKNVRLEVADIVTWRPLAASFDYVIAHGLYSWVPLPVREALLELVRHALSPRGVACVTYNTYPGCYLRRMLWEMMRYHVGGATDPQEQIDLAVKLTEFVRAAAPPAADTNAALGEEIEFAISRKHRNVLFHDDLSPSNDPVYFHEFAAHARRHGLSFVSETEPHVTGNYNIPAAAAEEMRAMSRDNPERREQYYDFATVRRFRRTLLARDPHQPQGTVDPLALRDLYFQGNGVHDGIDLAAGTPMTFRAKHCALTSGCAIAKAALVVLVECRPELLTYDELIDRAVRKLGRSADSPAEEAEMTEDLIAAWHSGVIRCHGMRPQFTLLVSVRPVANPLARYQMATQDTATTPLLANLQFVEPWVRRAVQLLNGERKADQVATEVYPLLPHENRPPEAAFRSSFPQFLLSLARTGLLIG